MGAWLGLKARELWRRNGEGDLPVPRFWPRRAAQVFWPLALSLALLVAVGLIRAWPGTAPATEQRELQPSPLLPQPPLEEPAPRAPQPEEDAQGDADRELPQELQEPQEPLKPLEPQEPLQSVDPQQAVDPLLQQWSDADPNHLIASIRAEPESNTLTLGMGPDFGALAAEKRKQWAERWQARAKEMGYQHLELRDSRGRLLGREALVGNGMVVRMPRAVDAGGSPAGDGEVGASDGIVRSAPWGSGAALGATPRRASPGRSALWGLHRQPAVGPR